MVQVKVEGDLYKKDSVKSGPFEIAYYEAGAGPAVLILHGVGGVVRFAGLDALADRFRFIVPEIPGLHGAPYDHSNNMRDLARIMTKFAEQLGLEHYHVIGFAAAAKVAAWLAAEAGEQVETLVLSSPIAILPEDRRLPLVSTESLRRQAEGGSPAGMSGVMSVNESAFVKRIFGQNRDEEFETMLAELKVPVLALFGTEDYLVPHEVGRLYREKMPNCHYILVPYSGPLIATQRASAFASVVGDFLTWKSEFIYDHNTGVLNP
jgi:pimeloyl-ACP methyl ester carboxylesterase